VGAARPRNDSSPRRLDRPPAVQYDGGAPHGRSTGTLLADGVIDEVVARLKSGRRPTSGWSATAARPWPPRSTRRARPGRSRTTPPTWRGAGSATPARSGPWTGAAASARPPPRRPGRPRRPTPSRAPRRGVRVPRPVLFYEGVLLMEVVVDAAGHPAPRLIDAR